MKSTNHDNYNKQPLAESVSLKIVRKRFWHFALIATAVLLLSSDSFGQTGTLTDDAYTSPNSNVQLGNLSGKGPAIVVAGSNAKISDRPADSRNSDDAFARPFRAWTSNTSSGSLLLRRPHLPHLGVARLHRRAVDVAELLHRAGAHLGSAGDGCTRACRKVSPGSGLPRNEPCRHDRGRRPDRASSPWTSLPRP